MRQNRHFPTRRTVLPLFFLLLNTLLLSTSVALWWGERSNTLFDNGRWIVGKDTGKFVFYTYNFMFRPLEKSRVLLNNDMAYQEILYRHGEGPRRHLERLKFEIIVDRDGYLWIELRKAGQRMTGFRLSRNKDNPSGFYRFDEKGEVVEHLPLEYDPKGLLANWPIVDLTLADGVWHFDLGGRSLGSFPDSGPRDGLFGFRGSGSTRAVVGVRRIRMHFRKPEGWPRTWTEREDFKPSLVTRAALPISLFSLVVLSLRLWRRRLLAAFLPEERRTSFAAADEVGLTLSLAVLLFLPRPAEGFHISAALLAAEVAGLLALALAFRRAAGEPSAPPGRSTTLFGLTFVLLAAAAFTVGGDALGRARPVTWSRMRWVHPDAYILEPGEHRSSKPFTLGAPVTVALGSPFFIEGRAYREQLITADFVMPPDSTFDVLFQQQSFHNRGDPEGEELPLQRRMLRLTTRSDVPWGIGKEIRRAPASFYRLHGAPVAGRENRLEICADGDGVRIWLNGEETFLPGIKPLDFGETGFMVYDRPVTLTAVHVKPTAAQAAREGFYTVVGALLPLVFTAVVWLLLLFSGGGGGGEAAAAGLSTFFPVGFYLSAALFLGRDNLRFLGDDRFLSQDLLLTAAFISLLFPVVLFRRRLRGASLLYNLSLLGAFLALALFFWDHLPAEHELKLKFNREAVAPGELVGKKSQRPWYSDSRLIGSNNFMWKQRLGGRPVIPEKPEGTIRIFTLGGSQAWGSGAASSRETYDALLEKKLRARGLPVEVFNGGINGAGITKVKQFFGNPLARYDPDILIVDVGLNDSSAIKTVKGRDRALRHVNALVSRFEEFIDLCRAQGVSVVLVLEPMSREAPLRPHWEYYKRIEKIAGENSMTVIDAGPVMRKLEIDHFVWWDTAHLAPYGHQTLAGLLEPAVAELVEKLRGSLR